MKKKRWIQLLLCVLVCAALAAGEGPHRRAAGKQPEIQENKIDVCKLLTSDDIKSVQGDSVEETKPSTQPSGGLRMSQCLYRTTTPARSVSIALAAPATQKPRDFWRKQFHRDGEKEKEDKTAADKKDKKAGREPEEEGSRPRNIKGVGDEAYWVGGPISGALYVLRANTFIRISVGGVREEAARMEKSVALARAALKRL
ncbi:MAG TPA: hypothetical protein VKL99_02150 [Candidatus Angelobacter sp.]|nr:hypothetical protein [Candidatus Angelobacter sp.]